MKNIYKNIIFFYNHLLYLINEYIFYVVIITYLWIYYISNFHLFMFIDLYYLIMLIFIILCVCILSLVNVSLYDLFYLRWRIELQRGIIHLGISYADRWNIVIFYPSNCKHCIRLMNGKHRLLYLVWRQGNILEYLR